MPVAETKPWTLTATDSDGLSTSASTELTLGTNPDPADKFNITLRFAPGLPDWQIAAAQQAAADWEAVLRSGEPSAHLYLDGNTLGGLLSANGLAGPFDGEVDDVMIDVGPVPTTNGRGAYGLSAVHRSDGTTVYGVMAIGNGDFDWNSRQAVMSTVLTHEMGHVLGIGNGDTWWNRPMTGNYPKLSFAGSNATAEVPDNFDAQAGVPLVDTGLPIGDIGAHPKAGVDDRSWSGQHFTTDGHHGNRLVRGHLAALARFPPRPRTRHRSGLGGGAPRVLPVLIAAGPGRRSTRTGASTTAPPVAPRGRAPRAGWGRRARSSNRLRARCGPG